MTREFPLLDRTLTRAARDRNFRIVRYCVVGAFVALIAAYPASKFFLWFVNASGTTSNDGERLGAYLSGIATFVFFAAAILVPIFRAADTLAVERREGTLGLVLITGASPRDIVLAHFAAVFLEAEILMLSVMPLLAFAALFGGIDVSVVAMRFLLLTATAFFLTSVGILASAYTRSPSTARFTLATVIGLIVVSSLVTPLSSINPAFAAVRAAVPGFFVSDLFSPLLFAFAVGSACLWKSVRIVAETPEDFVVAVRKSNAGRRESRWLSPLTRLCYAMMEDSGWIGRSRVLRVIATLIMAVIGWIPGLGIYLLLVLLYRTTVNSLQVLRRDGSFDSLLVTPVSNDEFGTAIFRASALHAVPYLVAAALPNLLFLRVASVSGELAFAAMSLVQALSHAATAYFVLVLALHYGAIFGKGTYRAVWVFLGTTICINFIVFACAIIADELGIPIGLMARSTMPIVDFSHFLEPVLFCLAAIPYRRRLGERLARAASGELDTASAKTTFPETGMLKFTW